MQRSYSVCLFTSLLHPASTQHPPDQKRPAPNEGTECHSSRPARARRRKSGMVQGRWLSSPTTCPRPQSTASTTFADAKAHFAFDESLPFHTLPRTLRSLLPAYDNIYVDILNPSSRRSSPRSILKYLSPSSEPRSEYDIIMEALNSSRRRPLAPMVAKLRSIKSPAEQAVMRAAAGISGTAFAKVNLSFTPSKTQRDAEFMPADNAIHPARHVGTCHRVPF